MAEQAQRPRCVECRGRFVPQALRDRFPGWDLVCTPCVDDGSWVDTIPGEDGENEI